MKKGTFVLLPVQLIVFKVSTRFAKNLLSVFQSEHPTQFGSTASVVSAFTEVSSFSLSLLNVFWVSSVPSLYSCYSRLPITRTLANSNLALTQPPKSISSGFLSCVYFNFTLGDSNPG